MAICKFFQQGYCKYGQACRFEHVYGSKYNYQAPSVSPSVNTSQVTDEQLLNQVNQDVQACLQGKQWLLSSYAPFKDKVLFPGIIDMSPEEARLIIYEAKANNNVDQAVDYINSMLNMNRKKYEELLQPTTSILKILRSIYNGELSAQCEGQNTVYNSSLNTDANKNASSVFRSAVQSTVGFGHTPSVITLANTNSVFGPGIFTSNNTAAKSIFAQANQSVFRSNQSSGLVQQKAEVKSIFAQAAQNSFGQTQNTFGSQILPIQTSLFAQQSTPFTQQSSPFAQQSSPFAPQSSPFAQQNAPIQQSTFIAPKDIFQNNETPNSKLNDQIYSKMEEISKEDLEQFENSSFTLGCVPEDPPPQSLCV